MRLAARSLLLATLCACSYPDYAFDDGDASSPIDSTLQETDATGDVTDAAHDVLGDSSDGPLQDVPDALTDTKTPPDTTPPPDTTVVDTAPEVVVDTHVSGCGDYPTAIFCDDWDTSPAGVPEKHWTGTYAVNGGLLLMDAGDSSPNSFLSRIVDQTTGAEESATLYQTFDVPTLTTTVQLDVDMMLNHSAYAAGDGIILAKVGKSGGRGFDLGLGPGGFYVETLGVTSGGSNLSTPVPVGRWFHVRLKGTLMTSGATVQIWVDDLTSAAYDVTGVSTATVDDLHEQLTIGVYGNAAPFTAFDAHFDTAAITFP